MHTINTTFNNIHIEDVERGADLTLFLARRGLSQKVDQILVSDRTDRRTDGRTDVVSILWAFLVLKN